MSGSSVFIKSQRYQSMLRTDQILWKTEDNLRPAINGTMEGELKVQMKGKGVRHSIQKAGVLCT